MDRKGEEKMINPLIEQSAMQVGPELGATIILKATAVLTASGLATFGLRRASASVRYAVWSVAMFMLILLPVLSLVVPTSWPGEVIPSAETPPPSVHSLVSQATTLGPAGILVPVEEGGGPVAVAGSTLSVPLSSITSILEVLLIVWFAGSAVMLGRLVLHLLRVRALTRSGWEVTDPEMHAIARDSVAATGAKRPVRVIMTDRSSLPFAWGVLNPTVVLPASASRWPAEQKKSVLLHEIAHIARWDYPIHLAVEIVKALYWPNPLVWFACRRCAMERERACDDYALRGGAPSGRYASHLIEIARVQIESTPLTATTMAGEPGIFERIRYVMNETLDRSPIRLARLALVVAVAFALTLPLATIKVLSAQDWHIPKTSELIRDLRSDEDPMVRRRAAWWLGEHEDVTAVQALIRALGDEDIDVRLSSAWALGEIKDHKAIRPLIRVLENDDAYLVREMAALALGEIEDTEAVVPLMAAFRKETHMRPAIVWALGEIGSDEADIARSIAFGKMGKTPRPNTDVWARAEDVEFGELDLDIAPLLAKMTSRDPEERYKATVLVGVLGMIDGIDDIELVADALLGALRDSVPEVRAAAIWSLDEMNPSRSMRSGNKYTETSLAEYRMNALGYVLLAWHRFEEAVEIFKTNAKLHPESYNVYDSLGEAYMKTGSLELAIANYEKAVELKPDHEHGREILEILHKFR
jgi:beta-lactamase regulating signal transducer with metallopeptidase domain/tetratricopeptide (TPR) repeat protein